MPGLISIIVLDAPYMCTRGAGAGMWLRHTGSKGEVENAQSCDFEDTQQAQSSNNHGHGYGSQKEVKHAGNSPNPTFSHKLNDLTACQE